MRRLAELGRIYGTRPRRRCWPMTMACALAGLVAGSCGVATACLVLNTWNVFDARGNDLDDALRLMADPATETEQRNQAHHVAAMAMDRILEALRQDGTADAKVLIAGIHRSTEH